MNGSDSQTSKSPLWDWPSWMKGSVPNPLDVFATPQNLVQPILPGWVFGGVVNVTGQNSSAPDTERDIVGNRAMVANSAEINAIKTQAAASRLDRVIADLTTLKEKEPKEYDRVAAALRDVLKGEQ